MREVRPIVVFDFDGTMLSGDSIVDIVIYAFKKRKISFIKLFNSGILGMLNKLKLVSDEKAKSVACKYLYQIPENELEELARDCIKNVLLKKLYQPALDTLLFHRGCGLDVIIVSASPEFYMKLLKDFLPVNFIIATNMDEKGNVTYNMKGENKSRTFKKWLKSNNIKIDFDKSYSYGNSSTDVSIMQMFGNPIFVNPSKKAQKLKPTWKTLKWS